MTLSRPHTENTLSPQRVEDSCLLARGRRPGQRIVFPQTKCREDALIFTSFLKNACPSAQWQRRSVGPAVEVLWCASTLPTPGPAQWLATSAIHLCTILHSIFIAHRRGGIQQQSSRHPPSMADGGSVGRPREGKRPVLAVLRWIARTGPVDALACDACPGVQAVGLRSGRAAETDGVGADLERVGVCPSVSSFRWK